VDRNKPDGKIQPFWKLFNGALMELKALPTLSSVPSTNHDSGTRPVGQMLWIHPSLTPLLCCQHTAPHVWEFKWDLLFHLIPLSQFDHRGTLLGVQHVSQHANWQLVLDLLRKAPANMYAETVISPHLLMLIPSPLLRFQIFLLSRRSRAHSMPVYYTFDWLLPKT
jgi:hypothetical protein